MSTLNDIHAWLEYKAGHALHGDQGVMFGDPDRPVAGVAVCWMPSPRNARATADAGHELLTHHEAQLEDASGLATCLAADADNVFVTLSARSVSRDLVIIARAERAETREKLRRAGATRVICPPAIGAKRVLQMLMHPQVEELLELSTVGSDLEVANIKMHALPGGIGKSLRELDIAGRMGVLVVAIVHGDGSRSLSPPPDKPIRADDELIIAGAPGGIESMIGQLGQEPADAD